MYGSFYSKYLLFCRNDKTHCFHVSEMFYMIWQYLHMIWGQQEYIITTITLIPSVVCSHSMWSQAWSGGWGVESLGPSHTSWQEWTYSVYLLLFHTTQHKLQLCVHFLTKAFQSQRVDVSGSRARPLVSLALSIRAPGQCDTWGSSGSSGPCSSPGGNSTGGRSLSSGATRRCRPAAAPREKPGCSQSRSSCPTSASGAERIHTSAFKRKTLSLL